MTAVLRLLGLDHEPCFKTSHRVLSRARWSGMVASRLLLTLLVGVCVPPGPVMVGWDGTLERRWGRKIAARRIDRDLGKVEPKPCGGTGSSSY